MKRNNDEKYFGIVLADLFAGLFSILSLLFVIHAVLPIAEQKPVNAQQTVGVICAELSWPSERDVDLDLWGKSPTDSRAVGYAHTHGENLSLLRDVVGHKNNPSRINQELICANEASNGEWVFNVHYFSNHAKDPDNNETAKDDDIEATMVISENIAVPPQKWVSKTHLNGEGQERTMFRFRVEFGMIVEDSFNSLDVGIRSGSDNK